MVRTKGSKNKTIEQKKMEAKIRKMSRLDGKVDTKAVLNAVEKVPFIPIDDFKDVDNREIDVKSARVNIVYEDEYLRKQFEDFMNIDKVSNDREVKNVINEATTTTSTTLSISIHDKYRKYLNMYKAGYLRDITYAESMEILRWMESKLNRTIPINYSCGHCMFELIKMFASLENK